MAPRPKPDRSVDHERHLAQRIREVRESRRWSLEDLARRMTDAGCAMDRSAIHRIEQGSPPRRITLDEAVTFANVFGMSINSMLLPTAIAKSQEATRVWKRYLDLTTRYEPIRNELNDLVRQLVELVGDGYDDELLAGLRRHVEPDGQLAGWHGSPEDFVRLLEYMSDGGYKDVSAQDLAD